jgi:hypothetical protein
MIAKSNTKRRNRHWFPSRSAPLISFPMCHHKIRLNYYKTLNQKLQLKWTPLSFIVAKPVHLNEGGGGAAIWEKKQNLLMKDKLNFVLWGRKINSAAKNKMQRIIASILLQNHRQAIFSTNWRRRKRRRNLSTNFPCRPTSLVTFSTQKKS